MLSSSEKLFLNQQKTLFNRSLQQGFPVVSGFLNLREQAIVKESFNEVILVGGLQNAERVQAIYTTNSTFKSDDYIKVIEINYPKKFQSLGHRDVLGAILNIGIERSQIGDIRIVNERIQVVVSAKIFPFVTENFTRVNKVSISLKEVKLPDFLRYNTEVEIMFDFFSSLRLDVIVAKTFNISRGETAKLIEKGYVSCDHRTIYSANYQIRENELLSVKSYGRIQVKNILNTTSKGKIKIEYIKY